MTAAGLIVPGAMVAGLELIRARTPESEVRWSSCLVGAGLIAAGVMLFWASARLADRFTDDLE